MRPLLHFTPPTGWMNDPNGLVHHGGRWHLFHQHNPAEPVWGDIHWGHASSADLVHWSHHPPAISPHPQLGVAASGCCVQDHDGSLVALFTHLPVPEDSGPQIQSLARSRDGGRTWEHQHGVLENPGEPDFRDPKVFWHQPTQAWVMVLAVGQRISVYRSPDLLSWQHASDFGDGLGCHEGVWECPDLFELGGRWVMLVSLTQGAPAGGSGTQVFTGSFDGFSFTAEPEWGWLDHGPDNYATVSFANVSGRRVVLGWMSNWDHARETPTVGWRGQMTLPRELSWRRGLHIEPAREITALRAGGEELGGELPAGACELELPPGPLQLRLHNERESARLSVGQERIELDVSESLVPGPMKRRCWGPATAQPLRVVVDHGSIEVFAGRTCLSSLAFFERALDRVRLEGARARVWRLA